MSLSDWVHCFNSVLLAAAKLHVGKSKAGIRLGRSSAFQELNGGSGKIERGHLFGCDERHRALRLHRGGQAG